MSTEAFEDFYFDVCNIDYPRLARALRPLAERMAAARRSTSPAPTPTCGSRSRASRSSRAPAR
jgi:leucyl aminopeptidase (aminopeptidase T)